MSTDTTAALIIIGNEILSGKVVDTNSGFLAEQLRAAGVSLQRIIVIPDDVDAIADIVRSYRRAYDVVFTSGGVGPTHDDVTIAGVAKGLDRGVVRHPDLVEKLRQIFSDRLDDTRLKMSEVVEGTELVQGENVSFPTMRVENFYVLPGIPEIFREKLKVIRQSLQTTPFFLRQIYTRAGESAIAGFLHQTLERFPELLLGSYPKLGNPDYRVLLTLESKDQQYLDSAFRTLMDLLPADTVVRTE